MTVVEARAMYRKRCQYSGHSVLCDGHPNSSEDSHVASPQYLEWPLILTAVHGDMKSHNGLWKLVAY